MDRVEWLLIVANVLISILLIVASLGYRAAVKHRAAAAEEARLNKILILELRNFPRRIPPDMTALSDEELFV